MTETVMKLFSQSKLAAKRFISHFYMFKLPF